MMAYKTAGLLGVVVCVLFVMAGCETPQCVKRDVQHVPQAICAGARNTHNVLMRMDEWFRENLW